MNYKTLLKCITNFLFRSWKCKIEHVRGRHVVIGGSLIYIISFLIGLASTGISLEETDSSMEDFDSRESSTLKYSDVSGDIVFSKESRILNPGSSVLK